MFKFISVARRRNQEMKDESNYKEGAQKVKGIKWQEQERG